MESSMSSTRDKAARSNGNLFQSNDQNENLAMLVLSSFYRLDSKSDKGCTAHNVTEYLKHKFGDIWQSQILTAKAEEALECGVSEGVLKKEGNRYVQALARGACIWRKKKKRRRGRRGHRRRGSRRRRRSRRRRGSRRRRRR